jgi:hypothetical protein
MYSQRITGPLHFIKIIFWSPNWMEHFLQKNKLTKLLLCLYELKWRKVLVNHNGTIFNQIDMYFQY